MFSTAFPQYALLASAIIAVLAAILAWIAATGQRESILEWVDQVNEWRTSVEFGHNEVLKALKKCQESIQDTPNAAWRAEIETSLADVADAVATQGGTLRRMQGRAAARARHAGKEPAESVATTKDQLREEARKKRLL